MSLSSIAGPARPTLTRGHVTWLLPYPSGWRLIRIIFLCSLICPAASNNPPRFTSFAASIFKPEDTKIGSVITTLTATDAENDALTFHIRGEIATSILELKKTGNEQAQVLLKTALDKEVTDQYSIVFEVTDNVNRIQKYATLYITDVNDNTPEFINLPYRVDIPEDTKKGTPVFNVSTMDPDTGVGGLVTYNFTSPNSLFSLNSVSGEVTLIDELDYARDKFYQIEIMATDGGGLSSTTDLIINVKNVQKRPPFFLNLPYFKTIPENANVGTFVLRVSAADGDTGVPNPVTYEIYAGPKDYFNLNSTSGEITVAKAIDRESADIAALFGVLELKVKAEEKTTNPQGQIRANTTVTITINDVNDQTPTFNSASYSAEVQENTQNGIPITFLTPSSMSVTDTDQVENARFTLMLEEGADVFEVEPVSVVNRATVLIKVKNSSALDYEQVKSLNVLVKATEDGTQEKRSSSATIKVEVKDLNDNWPKFKQQTYKASIPENSPNGTMVIQIQATDEDSGSYGELQYAIRGANPDLFRVDKQTGTVYVNVDADKDHHLLDHEKQDLHYLTFEAIDGGGLRRSVSLEVLLLDVNDNKPQISRQQYDGYVKENSVVLERSVVIEALDIDESPNNTVSFHITQDETHKFTINETTGVLGMNGTIDYEALDPKKKGVLPLTVTVTDHGVPPLSSTVDVRITVEDVNDETPKFNLTQYVSSIPENSTGGTPVIKVEAADADSTSPNNDLIYRIESGSQDKFIIDASTGLITVVNGANLDRDIFQKNYNVTVVAIDRGTPQLTGTTLVNVKVTDVNNKAPKFVPDVQQKQVSEDTAVGTVIFNYTAIDEDADAKLKYSLLLDQITAKTENGQTYNNNAYLQGLFDIRPTDGAVSVKSRLDRETVEQISLKVFVRDENAAMAQPIQTATATLTVTLTDVNDNPPVFTPSDTYITTVSEAANPGAEVTRVLATDRDTTPGQIKYYIPDSGDPKQPSSYFQITNPSTGLITLKKQVNREEFHWMNFTVEAHDPGSPSLNSTALVHVLVEDVNDNSPTWTLFPSPVTVPENASIGAVVSRVSAMDKDQADFGDVMYFITHGGDGHFIINNRTGVITVSGQLDRESKSEYNLAIEARDNNNAANENEKRKTPGNMNVKLQDVNDCYPQFEKPLYTKTDVQENSRNLLLTVKATDLDDGVNAKITYSIDQSQSNSSDLFIVGADSGEIRVNKDLTGHTGWFSLTLVATDQGSPRLSNTTLVQLFVEDMNDHRPVIVSPSPNATIYIMENVKIGTWVVAVNATDKDSGKNGEIQYELVQNDANPTKDWTKFRIDPKDGNITTAAKIDREAQDTFFLEVEAWDQGTPNRYNDRRTFRIKVLDEDDNPPSFDRKMYPIPWQMSVQEEVRAVPVGSVGLASDPDAGNNSLICYYIVGGNASYMDHFSVNKTSGMLTITKKIDRETVSSVFLVVKASQDCLTGQWDRINNVKWNESDTTLLLVKVNLLDINDNGPRFTKRFFSGGVTTDTQFNEPVISLSEYVTDPDEGSNKVADFYIFGEFQVTPDKLREQLKDRAELVPFTIGKKNGLIRTNIYFQLEMQGYFQFKVKINDSLPEHSDVAEISIYLLNENQRVKIVIRGSTIEVGRFKDMFSTFLTNITGKIINVDKIQTHEDVNGKTDEKRTDMFIHAINNNTGEVLSSKELITLIDTNYVHLVDLFKKYNVLEVVPAVSTATSSNLEFDYLLALILVAAILSLSLLILAAVFCTCRRKYRRKLKAATAMAFGSHDNGLNRLEMPGTNIHAFEGSNPIWLEQYANGWPRDEDVDSKNSLDVNAIEIAPTSKPYDEQEMTMEMYNDEYDNYNRVPPSYLKAALTQHEAARVQQNNDLNQQANNSMQEKLTNGEPKIVNHNSYDNPGYEANDFITRNVDGLPSTEI